jgi:hypothetical protein
MKQCYKCKRNKEVEGFRRYTTKKMVIIKGNYPLTISKY